MKKYLVNVYFKNGETQIVTSKAKNNLDLELKISKEIRDVFGSIGVVAYIEYEQVKRYFFNKKSYWFVGNTCVGFKILEKQLQDNGE